ASSGPGRSRRGRPRSWINRQSRAHASFRPEMLRRVTTLAAVLAATALVPASALAHVERPSYWPDPAPDCSIKPCTGGQVPAERSLSSALDKSLPGDTRVVCRPDSLDLLKASVANAIANGYEIRPTDHRSFSQAR